jgi:hypothetical protein
VPNSKIAATLALSQGVILGKASISVKKRETERGHPVRPSAQPRTNLHVICRYDVSELRRLVVKRSALGHRSRDYEQWLWFD